MKAFVDAREPQDVKALFTDWSQHFDFECRELGQGDFYLPEHDVIIERKEASDYASSLTEGRLSRQADRMIAEHEHCFVVIEGDPFSLEYSNVSENSLIGMQTSLAVKRGVHVVHTPHVKGTLYAVERIFRRFKSNEHEMNQSGYIKTHDTGEVDDVGVAMLMQVDGISRSKAESILKVFDNKPRGAIAEICYRCREIPDRAKDSVKSVDGVGDVLASRVIESFQ